MQQATYEDAQLLLRLYELRREERMRAARSWFTGTFSANTLEEMNEQAMPGTDENAYFRMVASYWDMAASFVTNGIVHEELFIQVSGEGLFVWEKVRPFIDDLRGLFKNPLFLKNLETVAGKQVDYMEKNAPGAYEEFQARVRQQ